MIERNNSNVIGLSGSGIDNIMKTINALKSKLEARDYDISKKIEEVKNKQEEILEELKKIEQSLCDVHNHNVAASVPGTERNIVDRSISPASEIVKKTAYMNENHLFVSRSIDLETQRKNEFVDKVKESRGNAGKFTYRISWSSEIEHELQVADGWGDEEKREFERKHADTKLVIGAGITKFCGEEIKIDNKVYVMIAPLYPKYSKGKIGQQGWWLVFDFLGPIVDGAEYEIVEPALFEKTGNDLKLYEKGKLK